jgi:hypothetical protein
VRGPSIVGAGGGDQREGDRRESDLARIFNPRVERQRDEIVPTPRPPGILVENVCVSEVATNEAED